MAIFKGLSTVGKNKPPFETTDEALVKQDILNEFMTDVGERIMLPSFGSSIRRFLMEPLNDDVVATIEEEAIRIIDRDPRVKLQSNPVVTTLDRGIRIEINILYVLQQTADTLYVDYINTAGEG